MTRRLRFTSEVSLGPAPRLLCLGLLACAVDEEHCCCRLLLGGPAPAMSGALGQHEELLWVLVRESPSGTKKLSSFRRGAPFARWFLGTARVSLRGDRAAAYDAASEDGTTCKPSSPSPGGAQRSLVPESNALPTTGAAYARIPMISTWPGPASGSTTQDASLYVDEDDRGLQHRGLPMQASGSSHPNRRLPPASDRSPRDPLLLPVVAALVAWPIARRSARLGLPERWLLAKSRIGASADARAVARPDCPPITLSAERARAPTELAGWLLVKRANDVCTCTGSSVAEMKGSSSWLARLIMPTDTPPSARAIGRMSVPVMNSSGRSNTSMIAAALGIAPGPFAEKV
eukprot:3012550-Amphidinium_carterae.3